MYNNFMMKGHWHIILDVNYFFAGTNFCPLFITYSPFYGSGACVSLKA